MIAESNRLHRPVENATRIGRSLSTPNGIYATHHGRRVVMVCTEVPGDRGDNKLISHDCSRNIPTAEDGTESQYGRHRIRRHEWRHSDRSVTEF